MNGDNVCGTVASFLFICQYEPNTLYKLTNINWIYWFVKFSLVWDHTGLVNGNNIQFNRRFFTNLLFVLSNWYYTCGAYFMNVWIIGLLVLHSVSAFALVGWWRGRGDRISYREGNSILGREGTLTDFFPFFFPLFLLYVLLASFINVLILKLNSFIASSWQLGMNFAHIRSNSTILHVFPFNSEKKRGGVAVKLVSFW